jgi:hypothetical protein
MPVHATTTRPLQTLTVMPTSTRPKRKSVTAGLDDDSNGVNGGVDGKEKENAPVEPLKKKTKKAKKAAEKEEDGGDKGEVKEKPPKKVGSVFLCSPGDWWAVCFFCLGYYDTRGCFSPFTSLGMDI